MPDAQDPTVLMSAVPDAPEGYQGYRRRFRFPFIHKAGGAALPALLVAVSIVVVLIVVGVSRLLPKQAAGQIPIGANNGQVSADGQRSGDGRRLLDPGSTGSAGPSQGGSGKPSKSPPTFTPISREAESVMGGVAVASSCSGCSAGKKVKFIGHNTGWVAIGGINVTSRIAVTVTVYYICACTPSRTLFLSVNGGLAASTTPGPTEGWNTTKPVSFRVTLPAGVNTIKLYNPTTDAPDLDRIVIAAT